MSLSSYFIPKYIASYSSPYNPSIRIFESNGKRSLFVGGSPQSGEYIENLWKKTLRHFRIQGYRDCKKILVLGIGGGTVITILSDMFPESDIMSVDIDEVMITIAKKYFYLDQQPHIQLIQGDAKKFVLSLKEKKEQYDLIIVDIYSGRHIPAFVSTKAFLKILRDGLLPHGNIILNYLNELEYKEKSDTLNEVLKNIFPHVSDYSIAKNRFFWASRNSKI